jgi:hypothetical protein
VASSRGSRSTSTRSTSNVAEPPQVTVAHFLPQKLFSRYPLDDSTSSLSTYSTSVAQAALEHVWTQTGPVTTTKALSHLVVEASNDCVRSFYCAWDSRKHPVGFAQKPQLINHLRSAQLQGRPFQCTTWCALRWSAHLNQWFPAIRHSGANKTLFATSISKMEGKCINAVSG